MYRPTMSVKQYKVQRCTRDQHAEVTSSLFTKTSFFYQDDKFVYLMPICRQFVAGTPSPFLSSALFVFSPIHPTIHSMCQPRCCSRLKSNSAKWRLGACLDKIVKACSRRLSYEQTGHSASAPAQHCCRCCGVGLSSFCKYRGEPIIPYFVTFE